MKTFDVFFSFFMLFIGFTTFIVGGLIFSFSNHAGNILWLPSIIGISMGIIQMIVGSYSFKELFKRDDKNEPLKYKKKM